MFKFPGDIAAVSSLYLRQSSLFYQRGRKRDSGRNSLLIRFDSGRYLRESISERPSPFSAMLTPKFNQVIDVFVPADVRGDNARWNDISRSARKVIAKCVRAPSYEGGYITRIGTYS